MMSRATELRTSPYTCSVKNWPRPGTIAGRRVEASSQPRGSMTESSIRTEARVTVHWPEPNSGCQKISVPGASYPSEAAASSELTRSPY